MFEKFKDKFSGATGTVFGRISEADEKLKDAEGKVVACSDSIKLKQQQTKALIEKAQRLHQDHDVLDSLIGDFENLVG